MAGRPPFKPTYAQRERVKMLKADGWPNERIARNLEIARNTLEKVFPEELEHGADEAQAELMGWAVKAAKKGNASMVKWLAERYAAARAAQQVASREVAPPVEEPKAAKLGKKEIQQQSAEAITGKFAPPPAPERKLH